MEKGEVLEMGIRIDVSFCVRSMLRQTGRGRQLQQRRSVNLKN